MIHREVAPYLSVALAQEKYKLFPVLRHAAEDLAAKHAIAKPHEAMSPLMGETMVQMAWQRGATFKTSGSHYLPGPAWQFSTPAQEAATHLYFANLNTPEDFAEAEMHADVLDT
jgi:molybdopterin-guanine dinucleotide biosynthesis protein A